MLTEIDIDAIDWDRSDPVIAKMLEAVEKAKQKYGTILVKEKVTAKGTYINVYAYDQKLYRSLLVESCKID